MVLHTNNKDKQMTEKEFTHLFRRNVNRVIIKVWLVLTVLTGMGTIATIDTNQQELVLWIILGVWGTLTAACSLTYYDRDACGLPPKVKKSDMDSRPVSSLSKEELRNVLRSLGINSVAHDIKTISGHSVSSGAPPASPVYTHTRTEISLNGPVTSLERNHDDQ